MTSGQEPDPDVWLDEHAGPVVRPYAMTRGRTRPTRGKFDLISLVMATKRVPSLDAGLAPEHVGIFRLCQRPLSVAEVAAHMDLPLGTVRVLLGDLLDKGFVVAREPQPAASSPDDHLLEAVINGLRTL